MSVLTFLTPLTFLSAVSVLLGQPAQCQPVTSKVALASLAKAVAGESRTSARMIFFMGASLLARVMLARLAGPQARGLGAPGPPAAKVWPRAESGRRALRRAVRRTEGPPRLAARRRQGVRAPGAFGQSLYAGGAA